MATTGTTEFIDSTTADVFIPEYWSLESLVAREAALVWAHLVNRRFEEKLAYGDTIHVPSVGNLTASTKVKATNAAISYETITETNTDISIATWVYHGLAVESIVKVQNNRDQLKMYAGKQGYALALHIDDTLAGLADDVDNTVGTLAQDLTDDDYLRAIQYLDDANAPQTDRAFVHSPAARAGLLKLDKYTSNDYTLIHGTAERDTALKASYTRSFYNVPVYVSTNVEGSNDGGHDNALLQKEAFALILQMKPTIHQAFDIDYLVDKVVVEQLYGTKEMRDDHCVWMKGP